AYPKEIHALLGENGAGKSTLMSILTGLYMQDLGQIFINGKEHTLASPKDAVDVGIGMVHQHFKLINPFTVTENIVLGLKDMTFLNQKYTEEKLEKIVKKFNLDVDVRAKIWQLSVGEQQRVEIIKMLYRGMEIMILDEPTAVLTPSEVGELFGTLRKMANEGKTVIFITHKMNEVMEYADRITILREGKSIASLMKNDTTSTELAKLMVGRELDIKRMNLKDTSKGVVLKLTDVNAENDKGLPALKNVSFELKGGEILGIAGVAGNGQRELSEVITGLRKITSGSIKLSDEEISQETAHDIIEKKVSFVPEDRQGTGLVTNLSVLDNLILKDYEKKEYGNIFFDEKALHKKAEKAIKDFNIKVQSPDVPVKMMSGGNIQKLLLARETSLEPKLLVAVYPVRGLDIGATLSIHELLINEKEKGVAILLISEDLEEIYMMADRVAVMYEGEVMGILHIDDAKLDDLGMMMSGAKRMGGKQ
ncbi:MAG: ABC transporter ATP-binding protein, partial [Oscillospiraceae bacterium]|nr:ABC transporter ATP-binding protein [Oscillospiraceae bacterium]